jgi:hypothetical protein
MAEVLARKTSLPGCERAGAFEAARAGALFASPLQPSGSPSPGQIRRAVTATLQRLGVRGCAEQVAGESGEHPGHGSGQDELGAGDDPDGLRSAGGGPGSGLAATCFRELIAGHGLNSDHDPNAQDPEIEGSPR